MNWITDKNPSEDGKYIVTKGYLGRSVDVISFTVKGGWNSHYDTDGELHVSEIMKDTVVGQDDYIHAWMPFPAPYKEEKK